MSVHIQSLVWGVNFPTASQKLLALRLADFASEDGGDIYPGMDRLADNIGMSIRQTRYAMRALEGSGLIQKTEVGGAGAGDTNHWQFDVDVLVQLALKELVINGVHDSLELVENKAANIAPRDFLRVQSAALRVQSATNKGATHCSRLSINHQLEPSNARDGGKPKTRPVGKSKPAKPALVINKGDPGWADWLGLLQQEEGDRAETAEANGMITAHSRFPTEEGLQGLVSVGEKLKPLPRDYTARMIGEDGKEN